MIFNLFFIYFLFTKIKKNADNFTVLSTMSLTYFRKKKNRIYLAKVYLEWFIFFYKLNVIKKKMFIWKLEISSDCLNEIFSTPVSCSLETTPYTIFFIYVGCYFFLSFLLYGHLEITGLGWNCTCGDLSATMQVEYIVRMGTKLYGEV